MSRLQSRTPLPTVHTLTITSIEKQHSIPDATDYLDVSWAITQDGTTIKEGRHGFPLDTPEDEITASLEKTLATHLEDETRAADNAKVEEIQKQADETIQNLAGIEINAESNQ